MILKLLAGLAGLGVLASCAGGDVPRERSSIPIDALAPAPAFPLIAPPVSNAEPEAN